MKSGFNARIVNRVQAGGVLFCLLVPGLHRAAAQMASPTNYLAPIVMRLENYRRGNRAVNIVFHGHSVPAGYFKMPANDSLHAYPNQLRVALGERFPNAFINVIVTAIAGENSVDGAARFDADVLAHKPEVLFIDYSLNDRNVGLERAKTAWTSMIQKAQAAGVKIILLTPTPDQSAKLDAPNDPLNQQAEQVRQLAAEFHTGLVDSLAIFKAEIVRGTALTNLMSQVNHPNTRGHALVAAELLKWFPTNHIEPQK
jgi:lysophospholipase L1-like esterase